jgi:pilus assembly protein CpaE
MEQGLQNRAELAAVLICPNRVLAQQFSATIPETRAFNIIADIKRYPTPQQLDTRLRQLRPDVVLLDLSEDTDQAITLIPVVSAFKPTMHVIGLDEKNNADVIIRSLRAGATEFLCAPFDLESQTTVITRVLRLRESEEKVAPERGKVLAFVGAKAGMGTTTIATNTAFALSQEGRRRVLLTDFDLMGGTISFALRLNHSYSVLDALRHSEKLDNTLWTALTVNRSEVDVMLAPERPELVNFEGHRVHEVIEYMRSYYQIVVIDLPSVYERISQATLGESDRIYIVCNPELPSLHMTRKCISTLEQMGFSRDQFSLLVNRMSRKQELGAQDMEKVFNFPISNLFPEDYGAAHRALTAGKPIPPSCELGRSLHDFANSIFGGGKDLKKKGMAALNLRALLSEG